MTAPDSPRYSGGYVSTETIALKIEHLESTLASLSGNLLAELRLLRQEAVRRDVYDEQRRADQTELATLREELKRRADKSDMDQVKEELKDAKQRKWTVWVAVVAAALALLREQVSALI